MSGDDSGVDDVPVGGSDADPTNESSTAPAEGSDELWFGDDPDGGEPRKGISPLVIVLIAVAVLGVIIVLIATGGSSSDGDANKDGTQTSTDDAGKSTTTIKRGPAWPKLVQGRPAAFGKVRDPITSVSADAEPGVYLWTDYDGWHLWIVDPSGKSAAKGTLASNQNITDAQAAVEGEGTVEVDGKNITFDFAGVDAKAAGTNFNLGFYATELTVNLEGTDLPLLLGSGAKPSPIPAVISKQVQPS